MTRVGQDTRRAGWFSASRRATGHFANISATASAGGVAVTLSGRPEFVSSAPNR